MILKSKFFSILDSRIEEPLTRLACYGSSPEVASGTFNVKDYITIREVGHQDAIYFVNKIRTNIINGDWLIEPKQTEELNKDQKNWYSRGKMTYRLLCDMNDIIYSNFDGISNTINHYFYVMFYQETPIGILMLTNDFLRITEPAKIQDFIMHIGIRRCGILLIEHAVNKSNELGKNGNIKLTPAPNARDVYREYGFSFKEGHMLLEPDQNEKWGFRNEKYYFMAGCNY
ncbi:hypothetical protein [Xenorhabdus koppenhoeferi]|uniref:N-acetyltransferase domain-containing protein n=1 Tax=Xenorhabdus koppenhoeferi TaxID=351659 RepID=A0A1I7G2G0_9GAMM|nr:hypothetical protein [Xenorhabdus koppenhoeferi]SFU42650.1 hypothetical protein SAMN05421784_10678 [Xenorhabdus koppenhoeferi]